MNVTSGPNTTTTAGGDSVVAPGRWVKYGGNPVLGGALGTCFDLSVAVVDGQYRMWFSWRDKQGIGYATSPDGLHWTPAHDVVLGPDPQSEPEILEVTRPFVLIEDHGFTMWYSAHHAEQVVLCRATSTDGVAWSRPRVIFEPEQPWEKAAVMCPSVLRDDAGTYHLWYSGGERYEPDAVGYATSPDGIRWTRVRSTPVLRADPGSGWERDRVAGAHVFRHDGWLYAAYIGFANGFEDSAIGIARSADGITWHRHASNPVLTRGAPGDFDAINVYKPFVHIEGPRGRMWFNASAPRTSTSTSTSVQTEDRVEQIGHAESRFTFHPINGSPTHPTGGTTP